MKFSTKSEYATRAMVDLAIHHGNGPIMIKSIAQREEISERYLEQLLLPLKAAGLLRTVRGARGGFTLARPPAQIKLSEIIHVTEGSISPVECVDDAGLCSKSVECVTREIWTELKQAMDGVLKSITLNDLAERYKQKNKTAEPMYYI